MAEPCRRPTRRSVSSHSSGSFPSPDLQHTKPLTGWRCRTCNRPLHTDGNTIGECLLICISTHQTKSKWTRMQEDLPCPVLIPSQIQDRTLLFDDIWFDFQELKDINEAHRQHINCTSKDRGALKTQAPLPWLLYRRRDGKSGQTRNQENYNQIWESCLGENDGLGLPIRFLTIKKSDLAENARRSRLSNDDTRSENLFSPSKTPSSSSSVCESPVFGQVDLLNPFCPEDLAAVSTDLEHTPAWEDSCQRIPTSEWRVTSSLPFQKSRTCEKAGPGMRSDSVMGLWEDEAIADIG